MHAKKSQIHSACSLLLDHMAGREKVVPVAVGGRATPRPLLAKLMASNVVSKISSPRLSRVSEIVLGTEDSTRRGGVPEQANGGASDEELLGLLSSVRKETAVMFMAASAAPADTSASPPVGTAATAGRHAVPVPEPGPEPEPGPAAEVGDEETEEEPLEIEDYTCATPYEQFIADVEAVLRGWGLNHGGTPSGAEGLHTADPSKRFAFRESRLRYAAALGPVEFTVRHVQLQRGLHAAALGSWSAAARECFDLASGERSAGERCARPFEYPHAPLPVGRKLQLKRRVYAGRAGA